MNDFYNEIRLAKIQNLYMIECVKELKNTWGRMIFGSWENFVTIQHYSDKKDAKINANLQSNIPRIVRKYTDSIKAGMREMTSIISNLRKKYKQEILDSEEFTGLIEELLEVGHWSIQTQTEKYSMASNLFLMSQKILIEKAPLSLQTRLSNLMKDFIDLYNLPVELSKKETPFSLVTANFRNKDSRKAIIDLEHIPGLGRT